MACTVAVRSVELIAHKCCFAVKPLKGHTHLTGHLRASIRYATQYNFLAPHCGYTFFPTIFRTLGSL
jgi:hypothetical protein